MAFIINLISIPYNAVIIAHERMSAFAYISILEAVGKLAISMCIVISPIDKLIFMLFGSNFRIDYKDYVRCILQKKFQGS